MGCLAFSSLGSAFDSAFTGIPAAARISDGRRWSISASGDSCASLGSLPGVGLTDLNRYFLIGGVTVACSFLGTAVAGMVPVVGDVVMLSVFVDVGEDEGVSFATFVKSSTLVS